MEKSLEKLNAKSVLVEIFLHKIIDQKFSLEEFQEQSLAKSLEIILGKFQVHSLEEFSKQFLEKSMEEYPKEGLVETLKIFLE